MKIPEVVVTASLLLLGLLDAPAIAQGLSSEASGQDKTDAVQLRKPMIMALLRDSTVYGYNVQPEVSRFVEHHNANGTVELSEFDAKNSMRARGTWSVRANTVCYRYNRVDLGKGFQVVPEMENCVHVWLRKDGIEMVNILGEGRSWATKVENEHFDYDFATGFRFGDEGVENARGSSGTGFFVAEDTLLTNRHVVEKCQDIEVRIGTSASKATVLSVSKDADLALLRSSGTKGSVSKLRSEVPRLGEPIIVAGYPLSGLLADGLKITSGEVSGVSTQSSTIQISAPIQPGSSGSPVFDRSGLVIGVAYSQLDAEKYAEAVGGVPQNVNFAVSIGEIVRFLRVSGINPQTVSNRDGSRPEEVAAVAQSNTVQVLCR